MPEATQHRASVTVRTAPVSWPNPFAVRRAKRRLLSSASSSSVVPTLFPIVVVVVVVASLALVIKPAVAVERAHDHLHHHTPARARNVHVSHVVLRNLMSQERV